MRELEVHDLGRMDYGAAWAYQKDLRERRKLGKIRDQLLFEIGRAHV